MTAQCFLEICTATLADVQAAADGGADRIELNMALEVGGLSPSPGLFQAARSIFPGEILVMVRTRSGGFCYSPEEQEVMVQEAAELLDAGCDGIVVGALHPDRTLDLDYLARLREISRDRICVFHRAMDLVKDWEAALTQLMELGYDRVLSSGLAATAWEGRQCLAKMVEMTVGRGLEIVAGSGVSVDNLASLRQHTRGHHFHGTFSRVKEGNWSGPVALGTERQTDPAAVAMARQILDQSTKSE